jgi:PhnB protein
MDGTPRAPYLDCPRTARELLTLHAQVFDCTVEPATFQEFQRTDGPADAIAGGGLSLGPVQLMAEGAAGDEPPSALRG